MHLVIALTSILFLTAYAQAKSSDDTEGYSDNSTSESGCNKKFCVSVETHLDALNTELTYVNQTLSCDDLLPFGRPNAEVILLCRAGYAAGYDCSKRSALWVSYTVTPPIHNSANVSRSNDFRTDLELPKKCRKELNDFTDGYDRGHLVSSATLDANREMNSETFLLSNISPQLPEFNRAIWRGLENLERNWSNERGSVNVIAGPIFNGEQPSLGLPIPTHFYKIIIDPARSEAISFLLPHEALSIAQLDRYRTSIDKIESISGIDFLSLLADDAETSLEKQVSKGW